MDLERASSDSLVGQELAGKYRVVSRLGAGGFGTVYSALNLTLGTEVAVKVSRGPDDNARALREAQAAAGLRSPYTVRVYDVGRLPDGALFIVMELLPGASLRERLATRGALAVPLAAEWLGQVCSALHEAHAQGLVHRDIKPSNLFVVEGPNLEAHVKLVDFGLVKSSETSQGDLTRSGAVMGSPRYMSPEQVRGIDITHQSDIWSLGVVLYECLSGRLPFERDTSHATLVAIASEPPRPLAEVAKGLPDDVYRVVARCLRKAPADRFPDAQSLGVALAALVTPVPKRRSSVPPAPSVVGPERPETTPETAGSLVTDQTAMGRPDVTTHPPAIGADGRRRKARAAQFLLVGAVVGVVTVLLVSGASESRTGVAPVAGSALVPPSADAIVESSPPAVKPSAPVASAIPSASATTRRSAPARTRPLIPAETPSAAVPFTPSAAPSSRLAREPDF